MSDMYLLQPLYTYFLFQDKYILTSMSILCSICVWHACIPRFLLTHESVHLADKIALAVIGCVYVMFHIFYFTWIYLQVTRELLYINYTKNHDDWSEIITGGGGGGVSYFIK